MFSLRHLLSVRPNDSDLYPRSSYLSFIQKYSVTHLLCHAVYVKKELPFSLYLSIENSEDGK